MSGAATGFGDDVCRSGSRGKGPGWLLGLGGGSNMDLAKVTACVLAHGATPRLPGRLCCPPGRCFRGLCANHAGTGSEVTAGSVLSDPERGMKVAVLSDFCGRTSSSIPVDGQLPGFMSLPTAESTR
ncbi:MAG: hypothetical protein Ct9H300mP1_06970 [Planctomycetaceae bacterium]|nr:MAG: hypothetical protein Ct9H300mP1_06970 [Planctomycetaceae bacterium]